MSAWLTLHNDLKRRCGPDALTPTQLTAYTRLCHLLRTPGWVNLCGKSGSGKTYVAWAVARATGAEYVPLPSSLTQLQAQPLAVVVDCAPVREAALRRVLAECDLLNIQTVLLVSREPTELPLVRVILPSPTDDDLSQVRTVITRLGRYRSSSGTLPKSYWDLLLASI